VFLDDAEFRHTWAQPGRYYLVAQEAQTPRFQVLAGTTGLNLVAASGGKKLFTNHPLGADARLSTNENAGDFKLSASN
jgi:hypothetical protein